MCASKKTNGGRFSFTFSRSCFHFGSWKNGKMAQLIKTHHALHGVTHQPLVSLKPTASSDLRSVSSGVGICPQLQHLSGGKIWTEWYHDAQQSGLLGFISFIQKYNEVTMQRRIDDGEDFLDAVLNVDRHLEESRIVLQTATFWFSQLEASQLNGGLPGCWWSTARLLDISIEREPHGMARTARTARTISRSDFMGNLSCQHLLLLIFLTRLGRNLEQNKKTRWLCSNIKYIRKFTQIFIQMPYCINIALILHISEYIPNISFPEIPETPPFLVPLSLAPCGRCHPSSARRIWLTEWCFSGACWSIWRPKLGRHWNVANVGIPIVQLVRLI